MTTRTLVLLVALVPLACDATDGSTDFAHRTMDVELKAISADDDSGPAADGGLAAPDGDGDVLAIVSASVHIRDIELYLPEGVGCDDVDDDDLGGFDCEDDDGDDDSDDAKLVLDGPFDVDLVSGEIVGDEVALPTGTYRRVDVRVDDDEDDVTFAAAGTMDLDGEDVEVQIQLDFNEDVRFEGDLTIGEDDKVGSLVVGFDVQQWLAGVPLHECVRREGSTDGPLVVGEDNSGSGSCSDLENAIRDNVEASGKLIAQ